MLAVKVGALTGKEWDPITRDRDMCDDPIEVENVEPSDAQGFISPKEVVAPPSAGDILPSPLTYFLLHLWQRKLVIHYLVRQK